MNGYLVHHGVKGMKWGVRKEEYKAADRAGRKKIRKDFNRKVDAKLEKYKNDKGPERKTLFGTENLADSAAKSYFDAEKKQDFNEWKGDFQKQNEIESRLTKDQINNGRYRVARSKQIRGNTIATTGGLAVGGAVSAIGGLALGGAATLASGGSVAIAALLASGVATLSLRKSMEVSYWKQKKNFYGRERAEMAINSKKPKKSKTKSTSSKTVKYTPSSKKSASKTVVITSKAKTPTSTNFVKTTTKTSDTKKKQ